MKLFRSGKDFYLSRSSKRELKGVYPDLVKVVNAAIKISSVDFRVTDGLRTKEEQAEFVHKGLSQTMYSKHLKGLAVDLTAILNGRLRWELPLYDEICLAVKKAAEKHDVSIRWGAAWNHFDITRKNQTPKELRATYIVFCKLKKKEPFIDAPHFELTNDSLHY